MEIPLRPRADRRAAGGERRRPGQALSGLRRAAARPGRAQRAGAAHVLRHERADPLPERAADASQAPRVARRSRHQRERHDHHRRDLVRQQRLPGGAGGDPARRRAAAAAHRRGRRVHRGPADAARMRGWSPRWQSSSELDGLDIGHATSPLGSGGMRSKVVAAEMATAAGIPTVIASGLEPGTRSWRPRPDAGRDAVRRQRGPLLELQAVAEVRQARARPRAGRCRRGARATGGRDQPAAGRHRRRVPGTSTPATRSRSRMTASRSARGSATTRRSELRQVRGTEVRRGPRAAAARERGGGPPGLLRARVTCPNLCADGHDRDLGQPISALRPSERRARSRRSAPASRTRALEAIAAALIERTPTRSSRPTPATSRPGATLGCRRADGPARAGLRARRDDRRGRAQDRLAARSGRRGDRRLAAPQRARGAQGAGPARGRRGRLRGAPERHDRRRGAVPEVGQRDRAARLELGGALERGARRGGRRGRGRGRAARRVAVARRGRRARGAGRAGDADGRRRPDHPPRRRGAEGGSEGRGDGAGDLRGIGQLPRVRRRERRSRGGAGDRPQRQAPAAGRLQRRRDAARARRRRGRVPPAALGRCRRRRGAARRRPRASRGPDVPIAAATEEDWDTEYLALELAVGVVDSVAEAIEHINAHGSGHSEAIVTRDTESARLSSSASTPPACTSTRRPGSPTAASSGWARRSATRLRSSTPAGRSVCASCARSSTWSRARATSVT